MESFYQAFAILLAGIALTLGFISLFVFLGKGRERAQLVFTILCLMVVFFILLPPVGLIQFNDVSHSKSFEVKRIFNFAFVAFFPWFVALYTGFRNKLLPVLVSLSVVTCYFMMVFTSAYSPEPVWLTATFLIMAGILVHGLSAGYHLFKIGAKFKATWLLIAITSCTFLSLFGTVGHLVGNSLSVTWNTVFFPINVWPLAFILIIGFQLLANSNHQLRVEKILGLREHRWQSLLNDIPLIILNIDLKGRITYINPYGLNLLNYKDSSEILLTSWSALYFSSQDKSGNKNDNGQQAIMAEGSQVFRKSLSTKDGKEKVINWSVELQYNDDGDLAGSMYMGSDVTEQEEATRRIQELKMELEKENLVSKEPSASMEMNNDTIGKSRPFMYAIQKSKQVAPTNASVLLLGETGVGKECFATFIQENSLRSNKPFVKVNCGALPAELIEDELFGHEKGAFTGAIQARMGRFEKANGGTIFLDEIGELPLVLQPKLLRVLQNGEFERVGGHQTIKVDVRIIAATNSDLEKEIRENRFREDLFYRLNVFPITIPPLRKRNGDIVLLIQNFIERKSKEHNKHFENISKADMNRLCDYEWPGNIRQLKNVIERAVISSDNNTLKLDWFYEDIENTPQQVSTASLEEMESAYITKVLQECHWKINGENGAAEKLVLHPNTLRSRMKKLNINVPWKQD